jgi:hypothetical protein
MENLRKRVDVKLVSSKDDLVKLVASPCFQSHRIMNENLIVVKRIKGVLTLNKPCYVGMSILDLSKTLMYDFHYNTIKKEYGDGAKLLFTDTDSLMYELKTENVYEDFKRIGDEEDCWDNSDYPKDSPYHSSHNKKVIGKFKDEAGGVPITEFVGLRSKMYSYVKENGKGGMTAKGVKKYVITNKLTHENFKDVISNSKRLRHNMNTIRSKKHTIGTYEIRKITLSCFDDKRYLLEDGVTSYAYGNRRIKNSDVEGTIQEELEPIMCKYTPVVEYVCKGDCEAIIFEQEPEVRVTIEEEIVRMKVPPVKKVELQNLFLLKIIAFRKAERKLSHEKRIEQLNYFKWDITKKTQYLSECDKLLLCEYSKEQLDKYLEKLRRSSFKEEKLDEILENKINWEVYESKEKLIRKYEDYLGIREDPGDKPVRVYKRWLRDTRGFCDKELDKMTDKEFSDSSFGDPVDDWETPFEW